MGKIPRNPLTDLVQLALQASSTARQCVCVIRRKSIVQAESSLSLLGQAGKPNDNLIHLVLEIIQLVVRTIVQPQRQE